MRPSCSVTLEPGLERGVRWGRDLFTFVTSAAGHMMRTLQKPRKNRPSKRQVNHRRFLHNMIQRKFADIEAANHRLATAVFSTEEENKFTSSPSQKPATPDQPGSPARDVFLHNPAEGAGSNAQTDMDRVSESETHLYIGSYDTEVSKKRHTDSRNLCKLNPKSQSNYTITENNQGKEIHLYKRGSGNHKPVEFISLSSPTHTDFHHRSDCYWVETPLKATNNLSEDSLCSRAESVNEKYDPQFKRDSNFNINHLSQNLDTPVSPPCSPDLSPLSLDSCDFSIHMLTDISTCTEDENSLADIVESQLIDMTDLLQPGVNAGDPGGCVDARRGDAGGTGGKTCADDVTFMDQSETEQMTTRRRSSGHARPEVDRPDRERGDYGYGHGYSCPRGQGPTANHFLSDPGSSQCVLGNEIDFTSYKSFQGVESLPNRLTTYTSYHYHGPNCNTYHCPRQKSPCTLFTCENNKSDTPFEGVAQSFSAPAQVCQHSPILTPALEDDWLFTDILEEEEAAESREAG